MLENGFAVDQIDFTLGYLQWLTILHQHAPVDGQYPLEQPWQMVVQLWLVELGVLYECDHPVVVLIEYL